MTLAIHLPPDPAPVPRAWGAPLGDADRAALLAPGRIGGLDVRCRVVQPAMETNLATKDGRVTDRLIDYYAARADGGVGLIIVENTSVHPSGRVTSGMLRIETDEDGAAFAPLAARVQAAGARLFVQLSHAGRQTLSHFVGGEPWAPSAIPCPMMKDPPRAMTDADVRTVLAAFVDGARRAHRAGADGVELHAAHGYLLCGFLSPYSNLRDDAWGGDTDRRCALPVAIVRGIKEACGADFPVSVRISADEYVDGGIEPDEAVAIAERLVVAGADVLHVSACNYESMFWNIPTYFLPEAPFVPLAARIKAAVDVPVISVGRLHRPEVAARVLRSGAADFVSIGRGLIADPGLVGRLGTDPHGTATARPCLACNRCIASINGARLECTVNPDVGFEAAPVTPLGGDASRRILIVGGGPAGLEAALRAAEAGHPVTLVEKRERLGGQLDIAAMPPGKEPVRWYLDWLVGRVRDAGVTVVTGRAATPDDLAACDVLLWAAGSDPTPRSLTPGIPHLGLDEAMRSPERAGARPLVLGGGAGGAEAAHWLAHEGAAVVLVELKRKIARDLLPSLRFHLEEELDHEGVRSFVQVKSVTFDGDAARLQGRKVDETIEGITSIVLAAGRRANTPPPALLTGFAGEVILLGDAAEPASIFEAVTAAARLFRG